MTSPFHPAVGVGLRAPHIDFFLHQKPSLNWLEIHSENYFSASSTHLKQLETLRTDYDISCHGIGLSLGSVSPVSQSHLTKLKALIDNIDPILVSDHLSWSENNGQYFNDLLPLPYTEEALAIFCRNVSQVQDFLGRQILIENPSSYLSFAHSTIDEWEFLSQVQKRTDCRILLDFNNIHVSAFNHGFDCHDYLAGIDPNSVDEIHLAGFTRKQTDQGEIWIDTHSKPVSVEVWQLYQHWINLNGARKTLIEWDLDIPAPDVLLQEAITASKHLRSLDARGL